MPADWFLKQRGWLEFWLTRLWPLWAWILVFLAAWSLYAWFPHGGQSAWVCLHTLAGRLTHLCLGLPGLRQAAGLRLEAWGDRALPGKVQGGKGVGRVQAAWRRIKTSKSCLRAQALARLQTAQSGWWHECCSHQLLELVRWKSNPVCASPLT